MIDIVKMYLSDNAIQLPELDEQGGFVQKLHPPHDQARKLLKCKVEVSECRSTIAKICKWLVMQR
jgi:hypothetical protein